MFAVLCGNANQRLCARVQKTFPFISNTGALVQILVVFLVICLAFFGGLMFMTIEHSNREEQMRRNDQRLRICLQRHLNTTGVTVEQKVQAFFAECVEPYYMTERWTIVNSMLYAFTVITTGGYRTFVPATTAGRLFSIIYALVGIPLAMLVIANIGGFLKEIICKVLEVYRAKFHPEEDQNLPVELSGKALFIWFLLYVLFGAVLIYFLDENTDVVKAVFLAFTSLTGGDLSHLGTGRSFLLPLKVLYASFGLAIATVAIDVGSNYVKKLHYFGRKLHDVTHVKVWFGSKRVSVGSLLKAFSAKYGIDMETINSLDLEILVEQAIEEQMAGAPKIEMNGILPGAFSLSSDESLEVPFVDEADL